MMNQQHVSSFGRLSDLARLILLGLQDHPMGGRELFTFVQEGRRLEPGTLWTALNRLERAGLILPISTEGSRQQMRHYGITDAGLLVLSQVEDAFFGETSYISQRPSRSIGRGLVMTLIKWIVRLYPKGWRERYEEEIIELLSTHDITVWTWLDLLWNAIDARFDPAYRSSVALEETGPNKRAQWAILVAVMLPLFCALFYLNFFLIGGLHNDYWTRNQIYPILAWIHKMGEIGVNVTMFCTGLAFIQLASGGIKKFDRAGNALLRRLIVIGMYLPFVMPFLVAFFPPLSEGVTWIMFMGSLPLAGFLLIIWGVLRREAFKRAFLYLLPWLGLNLFPIILQFGEFLFPTPDNTSPIFMPLALAVLLSVPISFVVAMIRLRLDKGLRTILLALATVGTLGMTLVQLMMVTRLLILYYLGLGTIWTTELIFWLTLNVLFTVFALGFLLAFLPRRKAPPANPAQELGIVPLPMRS